MAVHQGCLGRSSQTRFDLAGVKLHADVEAVVASLARCRLHHDDLTLQHWHAVLSELVSRYRGAFAEVAEAQTWVEALREVLDAAPLPSAQERGAGADAVARELAQVLGRLAERSDLSVWQGEVRKHLCGLSERYWTGRLVWYDVVGLPRTNNELEGRFGITRRRVRQQSGYKQIRRPIARQGAWLLYDPDEEVQELQRRLEQVPHAVYQQERAHFEERQKRFRTRLRWRRARPAVLAELEAQWGAACANSTS